MTTEFQQAIAAIKAGDKVAGKRLLLEVLKTDRRNEQAWLWLSQVVSSPAEKIQCLQNVLKLNPDHPAAIRGLAALQAGQNVPSSTPQAETPAVPPEPAPEPELEVAQPPPPEPRPAQPAPSKQVAEITGPS